MIRMPWTSASCPHFVLEVNQKCNISCKGCYKKIDGSTKALDQILGELDIAISKRRIQTVSIAGGEPTLHPQLCEIVSNMHGRNLKVVLATNGLLLNASLLEDLKKAGLDMIMLHIDEGQDRPDLPPDPTLEEINSLRSALAEKAAARHIDVGLAVTVYHKYFDRLPQTVNYILSSRHINFLFAANYVDTANLLKFVHFMQQNQDHLLDGTDGDLSQPGRTTNQQIYEMLRDDLALEPSAYLPPDRATHRAQDRLTWMTYFVPVIHLEGKTERFDIRSNLVDSYLRSFSKLTTGRFTFYSGNKPFTTAVKVLCNTLTSRRPIEGLKFLAKLRHSGAHLNSKHLIFENGPMVTHKGDISCCVLCPNATVRGNRLVPVCLADYPDLQDARALSTAGSHPE